MLRTLLILVLITAIGLPTILMPNSAFSYELEVLDRRELKRLRDREVIVSVWHEPGATTLVAETLGNNSHSFPFIDTTLARVPASVVLAVAKQPGLRDIEVIDSGLARGIYNLLQRLELLHRYRRMGHFPYSAVNLSLAPDRKLVNKPPLRTGERTMRRAISVISLDLDIPVFMPVGNDGPEPGFVNPWAKASGVFAVTAADIRGNRLFELANRPHTYEGNEEWHLFAAWGVDTIGALASTAAKSREMLEAEKRIDLKQFVGEENVDYYGVRSGTSFASPNLLNAACPLHQMIEHLRQTVDATHSLDIELRPFIRAIIDTHIDQEHPAFHNRLADKRRKYSGLRYQIDPGYKKNLYDTIVGAGIDLDLRFGSSAVLRFFRRIARPVPNAAVADGYGFVSFNDAMAFIRAARVSDLVSILADPGDPSVPAWHKEIEKLGDAVLLPDEVADGIESYCTKHDLVLPLSLY